MRVSDDLEWFEVDETHRYPIAQSRLEDTWTEPSVFMGRLMEWRHYPWRGVGLQFESGLYLSIAWGYGMHGTNYHYPHRGWLDMSNDAPFIEEPTEVEIAIRHKDHECLGTWPDGDQIQGYVDAERLLEVIDGCNSGNPPVYFDDEAHEEHKRTMARMTQNMREGRAPWEDGPADQQTTNTPDQGEP